MSQPKYNLTGKVFGRLTVERWRNDATCSWICICSCGRQCSIRTGHLISGAQTSCGCLRTRKYSRLDLTGKVFGRLTAKVSLPMIGRGRYWDCLCKCGTHVTVSARELVILRTRSCGCLQRDTLRALRILPTGVASLNNLILVYRRHARARSLLWGLTKQQAQGLFDGKCSYCGIAPMQVLNTPTNGNYIYNGIDRVDNSKGYEDGNVVSCCGTCNRAKMAMPLSDFLNWICRVYTHCVSTGAI